MRQLRIYAIGILICLAFAADAQNTISPARKKNNIGFILGANYSMAEHFNLSPYDSQEESGFGFGVGIGGEIKLFNSLFIAPSGIFSVRDYHKMEVSAQFNANFEYKWDAGSNEPYLLLGGAIDFSLGEHSTSTSFSNRYNMAINFGVGLSHWFDSFMLAPELVYAHGVRNLNTNPVNDFNSGQFLHQVSLRFKFMD